MEKRTKTILQNVGLLQEIRDARVVYIQDSSYGGFHRSNKDAAVQLAVDFEVRLNWSSSGGRLYIRYPSKM